VNDLETAVFPRYPELADIKRSLLELGAAAASMSGSGSSIFGIFSDAAVARSAEKELSKNWPVHHLHIRTGM
jgi:4-diphosphocytidyl-2-C-methyl-D-erythritol kinase